jgi:4-amino-4-deoxy-L-arabinose transferase-like glycosyltransferase
VNRLTRILNFRFPALAACLLFFVAGSAFLSHLGLQNDESLFANGIFKPYAVAFTFHIGRSNLPLMLMSYLGALKSWIYRPIFQFFGVGVSAMRVPILLAGTASVWMFYLLLRRVAGERAALVGCGLLAADSLYLLTPCFDWGPVALQHLLIVSGMFLLLRFYQRRRHLWLAWERFLLGLAMWAKHWQY